VEKANRASSLEKIMEEIHKKNSYETWVKNFGLNLNYIWEEKSARNLDPNFNFKIRSTKAAIVIGAGPSLTTHKHLEILEKSDFQGSIICTDRILSKALNAGITPKKFQNYFVVTIDPANVIKKFYEEKIVRRYSSSINGIFTTVTDPETVSAARKAGIKIHWLHALFDYNEGKKSFNQMSALMVRAKNHFDGLPALQTGGNVGTSSWFVAWQILKCNMVCLIGINHSWDENDPLESMLSHCKIPKEIKNNVSITDQLFPKMFNPDFNCFYILDPIFQYYSNALKEFVLRTPSFVTTINATEGGCIFGERITSMKFSKFLEKYKN